MKKIIIAALIAAAGFCLGLVNPFRPYNPKKPVVLGVERPEVYLPMLEGKRVALMGNSTAVSGPDNKLTLDILLEKGVNVTTIYSPEHGFRGFADAGDPVESKVDEQTGIYIASLFSDADGENPDKPERIDSVDVIVVDIQDIGLRYFTYYSTMMHLMDAAIAYGKEFVVLDRPNPNGSYVDGPILDMERHRSFVGNAPIPVVHGLTLGEFATMINKEGWLKDGRKLQNLKVVECRNYSHQRRFTLTTKCGPNIRTQHAVYLYPSVCFFEGTVMSLGRGTEISFEVYGNPTLGDSCDFHFTPMPIDGAHHPMYEGEICYGRDLRCIDNEQIIAKGVDLSYVIDAYNLMGRPGNDFFTPWFENLMGVDYVREMIIAGYSADEIKATWADDVKAFTKLRRKYLRYRE